MISAFGRWLLGLESEETTRRSMDRQREFACPAMIQVLEPRTLLSATTGEVETEPTAPIGYVVEPSAASGMAGVVNLASEGEGFGVGVEPFSPPVNSTIEGINYDENGANGGVGIPPDPSGAVGLTHVVSAVNFSVEWHTKGGVQQNSQSLNSFFAPLGPSSFKFDPKVLYDEHSDRFVVVALELNTSTSTSRILIAVSDDSDPNGTWRYHAINSATVINGVNSWADYPGIAVDEQALYITNNMFSFASNSFTGSRLWIIGKGQGTGGLYDGGAATVSIHDPSTASGNSFQYSTLQPALVRGAGGNGSTIGTWLVSTGLSLGSAEGIVVIRVDNPLTSPTFTRTVINVGDISSSFSLPDAAQLGGSALLDTGDTRVYDVEWRNNQLYAINTILPGSGPDAGEATAHWYQISTSGTPTLVQQGNIGAEDLGADTATFYGSVAVDINNNVAFGFAASNSTIYGGAYYTVRAAADAAGTVQSTGTIAAGQDYYFRTFGGSVNRWGDYSAMDLDPSDDTTFWGYGEYALTRGSASGIEDGRWGTRWASFTLTPPAGDTDDQISEATAFTLGSSVDGRLDPGDDVDMYSFNVAAGQSLEFDIDWPTGDTVDSIVRIFDAAGNQLAFNDDAPAPGESLTTESYLIYTFDTAGTYYVGVSAYANFNYSATSGTGDVVGDVGDYRLTVQTIDLDDQIGEAATLGSGDSQVNGHFIEISTDVDMFAITLAAGETVNFDLDRPTGSLDSILRLFDSAGNQLAFNDDGPTPGEGATVESYLSFTATTAGTYYIGVSGYPNFNYDPNTGDGDTAGGTGEYQLNIQRIPPVPPLDIVVNSVTTNGTSTVTVNYTINTNDSPQFDVGFYRSNDTTFDGGDTLLSTVTISNPADLTVGTHSVTFAIGAGVNEAQLPGVSGLDVDSDYRILAVADPANLVPETDAQPTSEDNTQALSGAYFVNGTVYVFGSDANDSAVVTVNGANFKLVLNTVTTNYLQTAVTGGFRFRGAGGNDTLSTTSIARQAALWGGAGNDVMTGGTLADLLDGGANDDTLTGGSGDDRFLRDEDLSLGSDVINDAAGVDTIDFSATSTVGIVFNSSLTTSQQTVTGNFLRLASATSIDNLIGGDSNDTLTGNTLANRLEGRGGNDTLAGAAGNDIYLRDEDNALGTDTINDSAGTDTIDFSSTNGFGVVFNLGLTTSQQTRTGNFLALVSATSIENITGGQGNDTLTGNSLANRLEGLFGNDTLDGSTGNDVYAFDGDPLTGSDLLIDSAGTDTLDFSQTSSFWNVSLNLGLTTDQEWVSANHLTLASATAFENVIGGDGNDTLTGNGLANSLTGGAGSDTLIGGLGNDTYNFAAAVGVETDEVRELNSGGTDTLNFATLTALDSVSVDLSSVTTTIASHTNRTILTTNAGDGAFFENVTGGLGNDTLIGNAAINSLNGGAGNDNLYGRANNDSLTGGAGNDFLAGEQGNDTYVFAAATTAETDTIEELTNAGTDLVSFAGLSSTTPVTVDLENDAALAVHTNRLVVGSGLGGGANLENITGGSGNDSLSGNSAANAIVGGSGNDSLNGRAGNDTLTGGAGNDALAGGTDNDTYIFAAATTAEIDSISELANEGTDLLNFSTLASTVGVTVDLQLNNGLATHTNRTINAGSPGLGANFENVTGGAGNDILRGNALNNVLIGGAGNDLLDGRTGDDTLEGGAGNDELRGGLNNDTYIFRAATAAEIDTIFEFTTEGTDTLDFSTITTAVTANLTSNLTTASHTNRTVKMGAGGLEAFLENIRGGSAADNLTGNDADNLLVGNNGNDVLNGGLGTDTLDGGAGTDTQTGGEILIGIP